MTISDHLLGIVICPETRQPLRLAPADIVARVNAAIAAGAVRNRSGDVVQTPLSGGLLREDGTLLFPIVEDIPILLADEAIPIEAAALSS